MKKIGIISAIILLGSFVATCKDDVVEEFTNDSCDHAINLVVGTTFDDNDIQSTTTGATHTAGIITDDCGNEELLPEVWFKATIPASRCLNIATAEITGSSMEDSAITVYEGSCGNLTEVDCNDDADFASDNFSHLQLTNKTPGDTYYIAVYGYDVDETGDFLVSAYDFSVRDYLTSESWNGDTQKVYTDGVLTNTVDVTNQILRMYANNSYELYVEYSPGSSGSWSLSNNDQTITLFGGNDYVIEELTANIFRFSIETTVGGSATKVVYTFDR